MGFKQIGTKSSGKDDQIVDVPDDVGYLGPLME